MTRDSCMVWCGDIEVQDRRFHACVYTSNMPPFFYATVKDKSKRGQLEPPLDIDLDKEQPDSLLAEIRQTLRERVKQHSVS